MASTTCFRSNTSPLKRSFDQLALSIESAAYRENLRDSKHYVERRSLSVSSVPIDPLQSRYIKRRNFSDPSKTTMLAQSTTIMSGQYPSFMSVYGSEDTHLYNQTLSEHDQNSHQLQFPDLAAKTPGTTLEDIPPLLERRGSLTSTTSYSTEPSPTTTSSTFDSPLMAEPSPESSPESASSAIPPQMLELPNPRRTEAEGTNEHREPRNPNSSKFAQALVPTMEDPKKNLKKLTIDMNLPNLIRQTPGSDPDSLPFSMPSSPFREPLKTGRRKPNNLTIRTPGFNQLSFGATPLAIPPTPSQKPLLLQAQSSPSVPTLLSPTTGPAGGMRLTLPNIAQNFRRESLPLNSLASMANNLPSLREEPYQPPKSQEAPEKGYTNGPCLIYDSGVYLYLEPTAEEAASFDTVINVAKEIKNPFESSCSENNTIVSVWRNADCRQNMPEPQTAVSEISFKSAFEWPSSSSPITPTTPRPNTVAQLKRPEYLHVKWDHNSEILDDLFPLCRLMDDRVQDGKKVLIHCQLGVSRSASLIIAYGLYKGYEPNFHAMYMAVKKRSQWVGPNMSLIYQLTDFKTKCDQNEYRESTQQPKPEWFVYHQDNATTPIAAPAAAAPAPTKAVGRALDKTVESRPALRLNKDLPPVPQFQQEGDLATATIPSASSIRAAPVKPTITTNAQMKPTKKAAVPRALPFRAMGYSSQQMAIPPHRPRAVPGLTFAQPSMDLAMQDVPAAPSLFSPRATEFMSTPFGVTTAGDLVTTTPKAVQPPPGAFPGGSEWRNSLFLTPETQNALATVIPAKSRTFDPRSPHQNSETREVFRSIADIL